MITDNSLKYKYLRQEYNVFIFERFDYIITQEKIKIKYTFNLSDKYLFEPELSFSLERDYSTLPDKSLLDNLIFNIGMIELVSYWKATCSPLILIKPFLLVEEQLVFWKKIYFHGLGEFFYLNGIETDPENYVNILCDSERKTSPVGLSLDPIRVLVPVGGGKDSAVTLELLKDHFKVIPFVINPGKASMESANLAGFKNSEVFRVDRTIHPKLLELNKMGFLNGHTPFSALIGFTSLLVAVFCNTKYIALSNESSANEPTVTNGPNHQYSKSYAFEKDFRNYIQRYLSPDIHYFSFLRPLNEMSIAIIFSQFPKYLDVFRSCNIGSKNNTWCGKCPKCLFTAIILSPFMSRDEIIRIFKYDILDNNELWPIFDSLIGAADTKPFECVGTLDEINHALVLTIRKYGQNLPSLLERYKLTELYQRYFNIGYAPVIRIEDEHFLDGPFVRILDKIKDEERF